MKLFAGDLYVVTTAGLARASASVTTTTNPVLYANVLPALLFGAFVPRADDIYFFKLSPSGFYVAPLADPAATPIFVAAGPFTAALDADTTHVYFTGLDATGTAVTLGRFPIGGSAVEIVATLPPQANAFGSFALDASGNQVYFILDVAGSGARRRLGLLARERGAEACGTRPLRLHARPHLSRSELLRRVGHSRRLGRGLDARLLDRSLDKAHLARAAPRWLGRGGLSRPQCASDGHHRDCAARLLARGGIRLGRDLRSRRHLEVAEVGEGAMMIVDDREQLTRLGVLTSTFGPLPEELAAEQSGREGELAEMLALDWDVDPARDFGWTESQAEDK